MSGTSLSASLASFAQEFAATPSASRVFERLARHGQVRVGGLWGSSQAALAAALATRLEVPLAFVCSSDSEAESFAEDLECLGLAPFFLPVRSDARDLDSARLRLQAAQRLSGPADRRPRALVASLLSWLQPLPEPSALEGEFLHLSQKQRIHPEKLAERLAGREYARVPLVERPGEFSLRGDILDLWAFAADLPLRIELFDSEIESLRSFEPGDQRSVETHASISLCLAADAGDVEDGHGVLPAELLDARAVCVEIEPLRIEDQAETLRIRSSAHAQALRRWRELLQKRSRLFLQSLPGGEIDCDTRSVQALSVGMKTAAEALAEAVLDGTRVRVLCRSEAECVRFAELLEEWKVKAPIDLSRVEPVLGSLARGFRLPEARVVLLNHRELAGVGGVTRGHAARPVHRVRALQSFFELKPGDLVVHAVHGLARFKALVRLERNGGEEEHLQLDFADEVSLYVPACRIDMVQRYVGAGGGSKPDAYNAPTLDKIGSSSFRKRKEKVERALLDLAGELLEVQAKRELKQREAWQGDARLVQEMLAAFPYTDTADQALASEEIARDLASERPMDRLLCGDVGFGKTEVALRAAFRVVAGGGQVAVLVPTTVLAHQHHQKFLERLSDFPVEVAALSRYTRPKDAQQILLRVAAGEVDILVGTHRLLSKDVAFRRLGLVIIDEEQRFGVTHKEHFKQLRAEIDVLTLTATPIPRTLHMSLSGVRDISSLSTPPEGRQDVETKIAYREDRELVRELLVREKLRGGQSFFLHNKVYDIEVLARELARLVPECSFGVGHGQMSGRELERVMDAFTRGEIDVLVSTTIVENGIDIPEAGTILIDEADHFGLAELHQLRGRVGRGRHRASCHLLIERNKPLNEEARARLKALEELTRLGSGFNISMKDLELRGAGNLLGPEQSGHIAAVGYDLYCRLLKQAVERARIGESGAALEQREAHGSADASEVELELGLRAYLPDSWVPAAATRLELLRQLDTIRSDADALAQEKMLRDRYGRLPPQAQALLGQFRLRARLARAGITRLSLRPGLFVLEFRDRVLLESVLLAGSTGAAGGNRWGARAAELRPLRAGLAHLVVPPQHARPESAAAWIEALLLAAEESRKMEPGVAPVRLAHSAPDAAHASSPSTGLARPSRS